MSRSFTPTRPTDPQVVTVEVVRTARVTPSMQRVTFGGPGVALLHPLGHDQWFRLFLPRPGQEELRLPTRASALWYAQYLAMPRARRPFVRNYTVRRYRAKGADGGPELDVDFVVHGEAGEAGPAVTFALTATPGDRVGILDQGLGYRRAEGTDWCLLVADETGLPAVAGILGSLPADRRAEVFLELPCDDDRQPIPASDAVTLHWLPRTDEHARPGERALDVLRNAALPAGRPSVFAVGESALATGARRHLVAERGVDKRDVTFVGYWRQGVASP
ncbi:siderophore-interacting protein [Rathayibacter sp. VKM Ac-2803]|uniref:siderophore-interacting protein n=1 Tax=unclassified Rathayibacter TaxID=2609250 RepID=UPI00135AB77B|nr:MULTISPECIES: siderophore-interacting protein [unclassified Rathayibacter]MWV49067.1 siderophore-interacting protein [Rathayibacter sp. VKM Ac-2803]MWV58439.1 siderophore-interacting protein [Rathayibacter sp. VKM Ac-2754]